MALHRALRVLILASMSLPVLAGLNDPDTAAMSHNSAENGVDAELTQKYSDIHARMESHNPSSSTSSQVEAGAFNLELQTSNADRAAALLRQKNLLPSRPLLSPLESTFTDVRQLGPNGWTCTYSLAFGDFSKAGPVPIKTAIQYLGLSESFSSRHGDVTVPSYTLEFQHDRRGQNYAIDCTNNRPVHVGWRMAPATGAAYTVVINPHQGAIITYGRFASPQDIIERLPSFRRDYGADVASPPLNDWSDIVAMNLRNLINPGGIQQVGAPMARPSINYIFHVDADFPPMPLVVQAAFDEYNKARAPNETPAGFGPWSRKMQVAANSPAGLTIIGSPIGSAVSKLLYEHKEWLGVKQVRTVSMFRDDREEESGTVFLFEIEVVRQPKTGTRN